MTGELRRALGAASLLTLLVNAPVAFAQTARPWVDPPAEAGASAPAPSASSNQAPEPAKSAAPPRPTAPSEAVSYPGNSTPAQQAEPRKENRRAQLPSVAQRRETGPRIQSSRKATVESRERRASAKAAASAQDIQRAGPSVSRGGRTVSSRTADLRPERRRLTEQLGRNRRFSTVQEAVDSGLEVMNLRTIEFPDGHRINVLTRPDPRSLSGILDQPY
jgi:hypothetical protein